MPGDRHRDSGFRHRGSGVFAKRPRHVDPRSARGSFRDGSRPHRADNRNPVDLPLWIAAKRHRSLERALQGRTELVKAASRDITDHPNGPSLLLTERLDPLQPKRLGQQGIPANRQPLVKSNVIGENRWTARQLLRQSPRPVHDQRIDLMVFNPRRETRRSLQRQSDRLNRTASFTPNAVRLFQCAELPGVKFPIEESTQILDIRQVGCRTQVRDRAAPRRSSSRRRFGKAIALASIACCLRFFGTPSTRRYSSNIPASRSG